MKKQGCTTACRFLWFCRIGLLVALVAFLSRGISRSTAKNLLSSQADPRSWFSSWNIASTTSSSSSLGLVKSAQFLRGQRETPSSLFVPREGGPFSILEDIPPVLVSSSQVITAFTTEQDEKIKNGYNFGYSVAVSGNTMVVGAPQCGARRRSHWMDEDLVVGRTADDHEDPHARQGCVYVFIQEEYVQDEDAPLGGEANQQWVLQAQLQPHSSADSTSIDETNDIAMFGSLVAISGDTIAVSASQGYHDGGASVFIFVRGEEGSTGRTWTQQARLTASSCGNQNNKSGSSGLSWVNVSSMVLSGDTLVVGEDVRRHDPEDPSFFGAFAWVFRRIDGTWTSEPATDDESSEEGWMVLHETTEEPSGPSETFVLSLDGDILAVGVSSFVDDQEDEEDGIVSIFVRSGQTWMLEAHLTPQEEDNHVEMVEELSFSGGISSLALSGTTLAVGASSCPPGPAGHDKENQPQHPFILGKKEPCVYIFERETTDSATTTRWNQQARLYYTNKVKNAVSSSGATTLALSGDTLVVVAGEGSTQDEWVHVFTRSGARPTIENDTTAYSDWKLQSSTLRDLTTTTKSSSLDWPLLTWRPTIAISGNTVAVGVLFLTRTPLDGLRPWN